MSAHISQPAPLRSPTSWGRLGSLALLALALAGCGGGGGGGTSSPTPTAVAFLDSFGSDAGGGGFGDGDAGADGTAGDGAPITNAAVVLTDINGKTVATTTDTQGYYRAKINSLTPPLTLKVTRANGGTYTSFSTASKKSNGFININVSGLTDKLASDVAVSAGKTGHGTLTAADLVGRQSAIDNALSNLRTALSSVITATKLDPASFNPLNVPFRANHKGYDFVLDNVKVTTTAGATTTVAVSPTFTPTLAYVGTYDGSYSGGFSGSFSFTIDASGRISGSGTDNLNGPFSMSGSVDSSGLLATGLSGQATFSAKLDPITGLGTGTWQIAGTNYSGTGQARLR